MKKQLWDITVISIGAMLASFGLNSFLLPNDFLDGGITGIAILIASITDWNISLILLLLSIPFLAMCYIKLTPLIAYKSIYSIALLAILIHVEPTVVLTEDKLLIAVFGGLFLGAGIGLCIKHGSVLDGSEVLGIYVNRLYGIEIGKVILALNVLLFMAAAYLLDVETAMYSILTYMVTGRVTDLIIKGFEDYIGFMISSIHLEAIEEQLVDKVGCGVTILPIARGHGSQGFKSESYILQTVVNRIDMNSVYKWINKIDPNAFVIEFDVNAVHGGATRRLLQKSMVETHKVPSYSSRSI